MEELSVPISAAAFVAAAGVTIVAGFVKGAVGFAMPMIMMACMVMFLPAPIALAMLILPTLVSNAWQALRQGHAAAWASVRPFRRYLAILVVTILLAAHLVTRLSPDLLYLVLGVPIIGLALLQLWGVRFHIPPERRLGADLGLGVFAGFMGGLSGSWGPQTVLYLTALDVPKAESVRIQGVIYGIGSVALLAAHLQSGVLNLQTLPLSLAMIVPAALGMALGFKVHDRLDQARFRRWTLIVLVVVGANLVRKGLAGWS